MESQKDPRRESDGVIPPFPNWARVDDDAEQTEPEHGPMRPLCSLPRARADAIGARLEAEGVPCDISGNSDEADSGTETDVVDVLVPEEHLESAKALLETAATAEPKEQESFDEAYYLDKWICPRCKRRSLELAPPSRTRRRLRRAWLVLLASPLLVGVVYWGLPLEAVTGFIDRKAPFLMIGWLVGVVIGPICFPSRPRRCAECGWRSDGETDGGR